MSERVVRCKHLKLLKECLPCLYGTLVAKEIKVPILTDHEKKLAMTALRFLLRYRDTIRAKKIGAQEATRVLVLKNVIEKYIDYADLVLAWRFTFKAENINNRSAEELAASLAARLMAQGPQPPKGGICQQTGCEEATPAPGMRCVGHEGRVLDLKPDARPLTTAKDPYEPITGDRLGFFVHSAVRRVPALIPRAEALTITQEFQNALREGRLNNALSIALTMRGQGYVCQVDELRGLQAPKDIEEKFAKLYDHGDFLPMSKDALLDLKALYLFGEGKRPPVKKETRVVRPA